MEIKRKTEGKKLPDKRSVTFSFEWTKDNKQFRCEETQERTYTSSNRLSFIKSTGVLTPLSIRAPTHPTPPVIVIGYV